MHDDDPCSSVGLSESPENGEVAIYARAKHSFDGRNNDELSFKKGDVIVVTQRLDGGWWEGTCNSNTGWFPSDYVLIIPESERFMRSRKGLINGGISDASSNMGSITSDSSRKSYRQQVMKAFLDTEIKYGDRITNFYSNVLMKIKSSNKLSDVDFYVLSGNLQLLVVQQSEVLEAIKQAVERDGYSAKVGGILLRAAPTLRQLLRFYCENHPKAISLLMSNREKFEEVFRSVGCEFKDFIAELSRPFRHLDTYSATLTELERSMNSSHPDRGDTQRAASVFRDIVNFCSFIRKQKEMQMELLTSGIVEGITLEEMNRLGEIVYMGIASVSTTDVTPINESTFDRCVVLFSSAILILEVTSLMNAYILNDRLSTNHLSVGKAETKNTILLTDIDGKVVLSLYLPTAEEFQRWAEAFASCSSIAFLDSFSEVMVPCVPQKIDYCMVKDVAEFSPLHKAEICNLPTSSKADNIKHSVPGFRFDHKLEMILPDSSDDNEVSCQAAIKSERLYSGYCLRPHPAPRGNYAVDYSKKVNIKMRKEVSQLDQEDAILLRIVEGYCTSSHLTRSNKSFLTSSQSQGRILEKQFVPQLIVAEDEKILVEELVGNEIVVHEKGLVDTVYALKDQIGFMQKDITALIKTVDLEQKSRRRLEELLRRLTQQNTNTSSKLFSSTDSEYLFKKD